MKPTDDERREVAAKLTRISSGAWRESIRGLLVMVARVLDVPTEGTCVNMLSDIFERLADLIEPEPERTCNMRRDEHGVWHCSDCDDLERGGDGIESWCDSWAPDFCPDCGARVTEVEE